MDYWKRFKTNKQRGEWVELRFMDAAAERGFTVTKPWGDSRPYDVGIEHGQNYLRVQVKGFSARKGGGYLCRLRHGLSGKQRYHSGDLDLFALYILPAHTWYLIPAAAVLLPTPKFSISVYPHGLPPRSGRHDSDHDYEPYRNAWPLLNQSRQALTAHHRRRRR